MKVLFSLILIFISSTAFSAEMKDFSLNQFSNGKVLKLSNIVKKQKVLINFWASWCTACINELEELEDLKKKNPSVLFIAINAGESKKKIKRFLRKYKFSFLILEDPAMTYSKSIGVLKLPHTFVVDKNRNISYQGHRPPQGL